jgi:hypothetical protein
MSRVLKLYNSDYRVAVQQGGEITLDTGENAGKVLITGNLEVLGETTTVSSENTVLKDNVLVLNEGNDGNGISPLVDSISGLELERGNWNNVRWIYDETVSWSLGDLDSTDLPNGQEAGTFYAEIDGQKLPLNTPGVLAEGTFYIDVSSGVVTLQADGYYEKRIFYYSNGSILPNTENEVVINDNNIPNARALVDYVDFRFSRFTEAEANKISQGDTVVQTIDEKHFIAEILNVSNTGSGTTIFRTNGNHGFEAGDFVNISDINASGDPIEGLNANFVQIVNILTNDELVVDVDVTNGILSNYVPNSGIIEKVVSTESRIIFDVDQTNVATFFQDNIQFNDINIKLNEITTTSTNSDLVFSANGTGHIKIDDVLHLTKTPHSGDIAIDPLAPVDGVKLYAKTQDTGQVGLYFVNEDSKSGELISKNRSLLFSMIF